MEIIENNWCKNKFEACPNIMKTLDLWKSCWKFQLYVKPYLLKMAAWKGIMATKKLIN